MSNRILLMACMALVSCGIDDGTFTSPPGDQNLLNSLAFSSNVLEAQARFVSYSKKAQRVSLIDPLEEEEIWGRQAGNGDFAVAWPDFLGVTLFAGNSVRLMSIEGSYRAIALNTEYSHLSTAQSLTAYSLSRSDGTGVKVIRALGGGLLQNDDFAVPWSAFGLSQAPAGQPILLASQFSHDGTRLMLFAPADGRYAVYTAASGNSLLEATTQWCPGDGAGTPDNASFTSMAWDDSLNILYAGTADGTVYAFSPALPCQALSSIPNQTLADSRPVSTITLLQTGRVAVTQDEPGSPGRLVLLGYSEIGGFNIEPLSFENICDLPLGAKLLGTDHIVALCSLEGSTFSSALFINPHMLLTYSLNDGTLVHSWTLDKELTASVALNPVAGVMYRMLEGGFGKLEIKNLYTGNSRISAGLFIEGLLD